MKPITIIHTKMPVLVVVLLAIIAIGVTSPLIWTAIHYPELRFVMSVATVSIYLLIINAFILERSVHILRDTNRALMSYIDVMKTYQRSVSTND